MKNEKYIIFKDGTINIFSTNKIHSFMTGGKDVKSAGFWNGKTAYGESTTLGVKSAKEDTEIIRHFLSTITKN